MRRTCWGVQRVRNYPPERPIQEVTAGSDRLTRRHVILLAHFFGVSREAIVRRLEELGLVNPETWDWFQSNGGISDEQARQVLGDLSAPDIYKAEADRPTTVRLNLLAAEAQRQARAGLRSAAPPRTAMAAACVTQPTPIAGSR